MKQKRSNLRFLLIALSCMTISFLAQADVTNWLSGNEHLSNETTPTDEGTDSDLKIHYTFDNVTNKTVQDESGSGNNGTLVNNASILTMGKYKILNLGDGTGYLDMGQKSGAALASLTDYTVSLYYRVDKNASLSGNGFFLWAFSTLTSNGAGDGLYAAYRLNAQRFALSTGGYSNEKGIEIGGAATKDTWQHILYRQTGTTGELYLNGKLVGTNTSVPTPSSTFTTSPAYNWIGRAPFSGDNYLKNTLVYDFRLYGKAVTTEQITEWATMTEDLNHEYNYGTAGDFTQLSAYITQCKTFLASANTDNYPPMAVMEFEDAIIMAQEVVNDQKSSQFVIDDYLKALTTAFTTFKATEGIETAGSPMPEYDTEKGFKHPGALHTQEDFDRVKALLAAKDPVVTEAYNKLIANAYSQSNVATYPTEWIIRGGGVGENYMNAARGASMAYQNALRWKISGNKAHAERAILILNSWANNCVGIGGDTNQSLASGLYGYGFANAAELVRDYEGWDPADFKKFQEWMLYLWYPRCIDFLRRRHDTWYQGRPGHYWSNWPLCNVLAVMSIGILCDDVHIYNQAISFYKHDQVGSFNNNRTPPIVNDGLTEFIGNLVPAVHADARGPYGYLGQMQESGRDQGHALMAVGLAVDVCQVGWNQGDDMFSLMDNRLAAGVEYLAAYNSGTEDLPWSEYWYHDVRTAIHNSWKMYGNNGGGRYAFRPYWDRAIGHYEGIKGVSMPYSQLMKEKQPVDNGGGAYGQTSGGFDHLGFTTLMCTRPAVTADQAPTPITPTLIYNGTTYKQNELGGLTNTFHVTATTAIPAGSTVKLVPLLPNGTTDTGNWQWDDDDAVLTKDREIVAHSSGMYRVTYTNENGVKSTQLYSIAVKGDCTPDKLDPYITANGVTVNDTTISVLRGTSFTLAAWNKIGWGNYIWNNGATTASIEVSNITSDRTYTVIYTNQGGRETRVNFHIRVNFISPSLSVNGGTVQETNTVVVNRGQSVELIPMVPAGKENGTWEWNNGATTKNLLIENVQNTDHYSLTYTYKDEVYKLDFHVYLPATNKPFTDGNYYIKDITTGKFLTNDGSTTTPDFRDKEEIDLTSQIWTIAKSGLRYKITSTGDERFLNEFGQFTTSSFSSARNTYTLHGVEEGNLYSIQNSSGAGLNYWTINADGTIKGKGSSSLSGYPFEIVSATGVGVIEVETGTVSIYPNPMQDYLVVCLESDNAATFTLYSVEGKMVKLASCTAGENFIQVNGLPAGIYFGVLSANGQKTTTKIIKK